MRGLSFTTDGQEEGVKVGKGEFEEGTVVEGGELDPELEDLER